MKSLYESILSSTKSGTYKNITKEYLLNNGWSIDKYWEGKISGIPYKYIENERLIRGLRDSKTGEEYFCIDVLNSKKHVETKIIKTIKDLNILIQWWKSKENNNINEEKKLLKQIEKFKSAF